MKTTEKINGITVKIDRTERIAAPRFRAFKSIEKAVEYMTQNDVISKMVAVDGKLIDLNISKTDEAINNWYENEMKLNKNLPELPTNMFS